MDAEDFKLKYRTSQLSDEKLLEMIGNHEQYRQTALNFAVDELSKRGIRFEIPPSKPIPVKQKKRWRWRVTELLIGLAAIIFAGYWLREILNHPDETNGKTTLRLMLFVVVAICTLLIRLTTFQPEDDE